MKKRTALLMSGLILLGIAWFLFRPERLFINTTVHEALPPGLASVGSMPAAGMASPAVVASGQFRPGAHETAGMATVYQTADGRRILRLSNFRTSNGPDVRVYLVAAGDVPDSETVTRAGFLDIGALKGNEGDQNYDLPAAADLATYRSVSIWCRRFSVNFGAAPLVRQ